MIDPGAVQWNEDVDPFREWDAAYVLGALNSEDRRLFERHLANCDACTSAVGNFAGIPGFLSKITAEQAVELADAASSTQGANSSHNSNSIQRLASLAIKRKQQSRRKFVSSMAIAASFVMAIGIGIGVGIRTSNAHSNGGVTQISLGTKVVMTSLKPQIMTVDLHVSDKRWGTQIHWNCNYAEERTSTQTPESYDLLVTDSSGAKVVVATWRELGKKATGLMASTSIPMSAIRAIDIRETGTELPVVHGQI
jgi:hypothetical protein